MEGWPQDPLPEGLITLRSSHLIGHETFAHTQGINTGKTWASYLKFPVSVSQFGKKKKTTVFQVISSSGHTVTLPLGLNYVLPVFWDKSELS